MVDICLLCFNSVMIVRHAVQEVGLKTHEMMRLMSVLLVKWPTKEDLMAVGF